MNSVFIKYKDFKASDFFADENFVYAKLNPEENEEVFWLNLGQHYPHLVSEMHLAALWIILIQQQPKAQSNMHTEQRWANIQSAIPIYIRQQNHKRIVLKILQWTASAAALIVFLLLSYEISQFGSKSTNTTFGEHKEFALPDSSIITLNSNSKLSYVRGWKSDKPREVWLEGEGFFEVKHTAIKNRLRKNDRFVVHVGNLSLTVLGTRFNVKDRRGRTEVALFEGSVSVKVGGGLNKILLPGQTFVYNENTKIGQVLKTNQSHTLSWKRGELSIEHSDLASIVNVLEDNYGYQVVVKDPSLLNKRFTGVIPAKGIDDILFVIKHTMNVDIQVKNKKIVIQPN